MDDVKEKVESLLKSATYKVASTMPDIPHSYTLKHLWSNIKDFNLVVQYIRDYGVEESFGRKKFMYYYLDGYKYWTMGNTLEITKLINKAKAQ